MQKNTKNYLQDLLEDLEIQLNTIESKLYETIKIRRKLQKFYKKVIRNC